MVADLFALGGALLLRISKPSPTQRSNLSANSFYVRDICCDIATGKNLHLSQSSTTPVRLSTPGLVLSRSGNRSEHFRRYFAMGKIRGTPYTRSHIFVHRGTTKYFSNSFVFKKEIEKEGLPGDITPALGAGVPSCIAWPNFWCTLGAH